MKKFWFAILIVLVSFSLGSCSSVSLVQRSEVYRHVDLTSYNGINVETIFACKAKNPEIIRVKLKAYIISNLKRDHLFKNIGVNNNLYLIAKIVKIKEVSGAARVFLGALAGRAKVEVECILKDKNSLIRKFYVDGESSGGTVFAGTTDQAIQKAAQAIVRYLKDNMK